MTNVRQLFPGASAPPEPPRDRLITEREVLIYRPSLCAGLLLAARKKGTIEWHPGRRHSAWYTLEAVDAFIETRKKRCLAPGPDPSLKSADIGSQKNPAETGSIASGMTQEMAEHAAEASAKRILKPQKSA